MTEHPVNLGEDRTEDTENPSTWAGKARQCKRRLTAAACPARQARAPNFLHLSSLLSILL